MRKIEKEMLNAIHNNKYWIGSNTAVKPIDDVNIAVYLHGNEIAILNTRNGFLMVNKETLKRWSTPTTKSRLRALGANVTTKKGITYLNGEAL